VFSTVAWFDYTSGRMVLGAEGFSPQGMLHIYPAAVGQPSLVVDTKPSPTTDLQRWNLDGTTKIAVKSDFSLVQSAGFIAHSDTGAAQTLSTGNTITVTGTCARVSPSAAGQTGMILPAGTYANQKLVIYNEGGNSFTFNTTPATSRLAGAATAPALPANGAWTLHWNAALGLWFHAT
jgi:hypothetical protein